MCVDATVYGLKGNTLKVVKYMALNTKYDNIERRMAQRINDCKKHIRYHQNKVKWFSVEINFLKEKLGGKFAGQ